jgi:hypothetical protein
MGLTNRPALKVYVYHTETSRKRRQHTPTINIIFSFDLDIIYPPFVIYLSHDVINISPSLGIVNRNDANTSLRTFVFSETYGRLLIKKTMPDH